MTIQLNGREVVLGDGISLQELIKNLKLNPQNIVIELNEELIRKDDWANIRIKENNRIEIISFVGGG